MLKGTSFLGLSQETISIEYDRHQYVSCLRSLGCPFLCICMNLFGNRQNDKMAFLPNLLQRLLSF